MEDLHSRWHHRWVSRKVKSFGSSINGLGVRAVENIPKGEPIIVAGGIVVPKKDIKDYRKMIGHLGYQIDDDFFMCPTDRKELRETGVINHSCNPNAGFSDSPVKAVAIRRIMKGEEVTLDYACFESYFDSFRCRCGSKECRKLITQNDWKKKDIQKKYGRYFSPYLKKKFANKA